MQAKGGAVDKHKDHESDGIAVNLSAHADGSASCCRFLIANDFLADVDAAPLVFPADRLEGAAAKLPPMQQILDVDVSDEEPEDGAPIAAGADVGAVADATAAEPQSGMARTEVEHDGNVAEGDAVMDGAAAAAEDADQAAVVSVGDAAAPAAAVALAVGNPEEIVLAE